MRRRVRHDRRAPAAMHDLRDRRDRHLPDERDGVERSGDRRVPERDVSAGHGCSARSRPSAGSRVSSSFRAQRLRSARRRSASPNPNGPRGAQSQSMGTASLLRCRGPCVSRAVELRANVRCAHRSGAADAWRREAQRRRPPHEPRVRSQLDCSLLVEELFGQFGQIGVLGEIERVECGEPERSLDASAAAAWTAAAMPSGPSKVEASATCTPETGASEAARAGCRSRRCGRSSARPRQGRG